MLYDNDNVINDQFTNILNSCLKIIQFVHKN